MNNLQTELTNFDLNDAINPIPFECDEAAELVFGNVYRDDLLTDSDLFLENGFEDMSEEANLNELVTSVNEFNRLVRDINENVNPKRSS